jgi:hypothetical protein
MVFCFFDTKIKKKQERYISSNKDFAFQIKFIIFVPLFKKSKTSLWIYTNTKEKKY